MYKKTKLQRGDITYSIITCNGLKGLIRNDGEVILAPIYKDIIITFGEIYVYKDEEIEDELLLETINEGTACIKRFYYNTKSKKENYYFVNGHGETVVSIDEEWREKNQLNFSNLDLRHGFIDGIARFREGINAIHINTKGEIVEEIGGFYEDPSDYFDGRDYLNYDGYEEYLYGGCCDEEELLYRAAFEDDPGAESNIL